MKKIILATSSPYRQEAFGLLDLDFIAQGSDVDEFFANRPKLPEDLVLCLSKLKADAVAKDYSSGIVIGFDSLGWLGGEILEKTKSKEDAFKRLRSLSGNAYQLFTGVYMKDIESGKHISRVVITEVEVRDLTDSEINKYLEQDPNINTYALGFDTLKHYSSTFVKKINGSYNNLIRGIPLESIVEMLPELGYEIGDRK